MRCNAAVALLPNQPTNQVIADRFGSLSPLMEEFEPRLMLSTITPAMVCEAYGLEGLSFGGVPADGRGQTIAIVNPCVPDNADNVSTPGTVAWDLREFDQNYLGASSPLLDFFSVDLSLNSGSKTPTSEQNQETRLDVQWAHAIAPEARIILVSANSQSLDDLLTAVQYAATLPGVTVVELAWGAHPGGWDDPDDPSQYEAYFTVPQGHAPVSFITGSGDDGLYVSPESPTYLGYGPMFPSVSDNVLTVGGTNLSTDASGNYITETPWNLSGGGTFLGRTVPDVSAIAAPADAGDGIPVWGGTTAVGTSVAATIWSGIIAIANQGRAILGQESLSTLGGDLRGQLASLSANFRASGEDYCDLPGIGTPIADDLILALAATDVAFPAGPPLLHCPDGQAAMISTVNLFSSTPTSQLSFDISGDLDEGNTVRLLARTSYEITGITSTKTGSNHVLQFPAGTVNEGVPCEVGLSINSMAYLGFRLLATTSSSITITGNDYAPEIVTTDDVTITYTFAVGSAAVDSGGDAHIAADSSTYWTDQSTCELWAVQEAVIGSETFISFPSETYTIQVEITTPTVPSAPALTTDANTSFRSGNITTDFTPTFTKTFTI